jgi:thiol-disulfide isomerase/thioredoxin
MRLFLALALFVLAAPACAQTAATDSDAPTTPLDSTAAPDTPEADRTVTEETVAEIIAGEGVHVVHFWAPWCGNSISELRAGWYEAVEDHPDVSFTFVAIWNDDEDASETLGRYGIPDRVTVLAQPDHGPSEDRSARRRTFLGMPITWTPTTWIFHRNGELAMAFNWGEVTPEQLAQSLEWVRADWSH